MMFASFGSAVEDFGSELGHYWALVLLVVTIAGTTYRTIKRLINQGVIQIETIVENKLAPIRAEVHSNGGGSIKDAVKRLEEGQATMTEKLEGLAAVVTKNEGRLTAVTSNLPAAYYETDDLGNVTAVNDSYLALFQVSEQEALHSQAWRALISEPDLALIDRTGAQAMRSQTDWYCSFVVNRKGVQIPVVARAKALFTNGVFSGYSGAMTYNNDLSR